MFIDRRCSSPGTMNDSHIAALLELARKRQPSRSTWRMTARTIEKVGREVGTHSVARSKCPFYKAFIECRARMPLPRQAK